MPEESLCAMGALREALTPGPSLKRMEKEPLAPLRGQKVEEWQRSCEGPSRGCSPRLLLPFARPGLALRYAQH